LDLKKICNEEWLEAVVVNSQLLVTAFERLGGELAAPFGLPS